MYTEKDFIKWKKYETVRRSGKYNMVTEWANASKECGLNDNDYFLIVRKYHFIKSAIEEKYGSVDNFMD